MSIHFQYKVPNTTSGKLRTPVIFYEYEPDDGPEPGQGEKAILHKCYAEVYNPSMKDLSIMGNKGTKEAVTIRIRDPSGEYIPTNKHFVELDDFRYQNKIWNVIDVRNDLTDNRFITILLGVES